jgi:hypothetical protein
MFLGFYSSNRNSPAQQRSNVLVQSDTESSGPLSKGFSLHIYIYHSLQTNIFLECDQISEVKQEDMIPYGKQCISE